ncbi:hypothetical protein MMB85_004909, partial [Klebsiella quasipneumoniae]|nr:hypothetical protein [Klebsiella quasipneumoniae]
MANIEKLGSSSPEVLLKNATNLDKLVNGRESESLPDRFGVLRKTWHGMEMIFSRFIDYITGRGEQAVAAIGWQELGNWAVGLAVDNRQQIVYYNGSWYKYLGELEHVIAGDSPENDGGVWSATNPTGKWSNIGDAALRSNLDSGEEGMGGDLVTPKKGRAPEAANLTRTVSNLLLDGEAGLRKCFAAVGDGYHDDTAAFNDWWECLMDIAYKRRAYEGDEAAIKFMLQKGPLLTIENGVFIYDGPGLNIGNSDVFVFNVKGESALSTKILLPNDGVYLFDFDNNPVHSRLSDMTIHGGLGAVRYKSKARNASSTHDFERLRLSRYNEC